MPRPIRVDVGGEVYHVLNRINGRFQIFYTDADYQLFEDILANGVSRYDMRLIAYCIMPNHWHMVVYPRKDGDLSKFVGWVTNTHTRRWHVAKHTAGSGHLYQGRYKSFLCQNNTHLLTLIRYVERNALRANLVSRAEEWRWSSAWRRVHGSREQKELLDSSSFEFPGDYNRCLNESQTEAELSAIRTSAQRGCPFGENFWVHAKVEQHSLQSTMRATGRPKKGG